MSVFEKVLELKNNNCFSCVKREDVKIDVNFPDEIFDLEVSANSDCFLVRKSYYASVIVSSDLKTKEKTVLYDNDDMVFDWVYSKEENSFYAITFDKDFFLKNNEERFLSKTNCIKKIDISSGEVTVIADNSGQDFCPTAIALHQGQIVYYNLFENAFFVMDKKSPTESKLIYRLSSPSFATMLKVTADNKLVFLLKSNKYFWVDEKAYTHSADTMCLCPIDKEADNSDSFSPLDGDLVLAYEVYGDNLLMTTRKHVMSYDINKTAFRYMVPNNKLLEDTSLYCIKAISFIKNNEYKLLASKGRREGDFLLELNLGINN